MYYKYTDEELRSICRTHIESFEKWARIIIHKTLSEKIGLDYIHAKGVDGNPIAPGQSGESGLACHLPIKSQHKFSAPEKNAPLLC